MHIQLFKAAALAPWVLPSPNSVSAKGSKFCGEILFPRSTSSYILRIYQVLPLMNTHNTDSYKFPDFSRAFRMRDICLTLPETTREFAHFRKPRNGAKRLILACQALILIKVFPKSRHGSRHFASIHEARHCAFHHYNHHSSYVVSFLTPCRFEDS